MTWAGEVDDRQYSGPPSQFPPTPLSNRRRSSVAFMVFLSVAMLVGAVVMALVLLGSGAANALVIGAVLAVLPVGPLVASFMWLDRYEPEPLSLIGFALGWGALVATTVALILQVVDQVAFRTPETLAAVIVAPITEEAAKGLFVVLLLFARRHELDGILDGIVYAGMVGVGFAFTENIAYLATAFMGGDGIGPGGLGAATGTFVVRGIFSPFAHPLFTAAIGVGVGYAVITKSSVWRFLAPVLGYCVAVVGHALWNGSALLAGGQLFLLTYLFAMMPAFFVFAGFSVWVRKREGKLLTRALADCANRGFLAHQEVSWLVRLPGRRAARKFARDHGGPTAAKMMSEYQQQAIELGFLHDRFLHDRFLRGTAPADFAPRGQSMVNQMAALRPHVIFPSMPDGNFVTGPHSEGGR